MLGKTSLRKPPPLPCRSAAARRVCRRIWKNLPIVPAYVEAASAANTRRAYATDWKHFGSWCRCQSVEVFPPDPQVVGLYITACASGKATGDKTPNSVPTIERLSSLTWNFGQRGQPLDRKDRHIATVMAAIRNKHGAPPRQKEPILSEDLIAMLETLEPGSLRGLRDRAMLLLGFAGGLRRSEIVTLDIDRDQTEDGRGWIEILDKGMLVSLRGKTGWREVEVGRGSSDATCPVVAVQTGSSSPVSRTDRCSGASPTRARRSGPIGSTTRRLRAWSSGPRWREACAATCRNAESCFPAIRCALAWPPRLKSMSAMCKSNLVMFRPK